jgi:hypothetical protein
MAVRLSALRAGRTFIPQEQARINTRISSKLHNLQLKTTMKHKMIQAETAIF